MSSPLPPPPRIPTRLLRSSSAKPLLRRRLLPHLHSSRATPYFGSDWFGEEYKREKGSKGRMCKGGTGIFDGMDEEDPR